MLTSLFSSNSGKPDFRAVRAEQKLLTANPHNRTAARLARLQPLLGGQQFGEGEATGLPWDEVISDYDRIQSGQYTAKGFGMNLVHARRIRRLERGLQVTLANVLATLDLGLSANRFPEVIKA